MPISGAETGVRVKDPSLLLTTLTEAAAALDALQARVKELEAEQAAIVRDYQRMNSQLADEMKHATRAEQERDEAYERAAKVAERHIIKPLGIETAKEASMSDTARSIAAAIRRLASGTEKEGK